jgi:hypothetical protein
VAAAYGLCLAWSAALWARPLAAASPAPSPAALLTGPPPVPPSALAVGGVCVALAVGGVLFCLALLTARAA